jgi:uncharacterized protein YjbI with pentapeptide repeats
MNMGECTFSRDELIRSLQQRDAPQPLIGLNNLPHDWKCSRRVYRNGKCIFHAEHKDPKKFNNAFIRELKLLANHGRYDFIGFIFPNSEIVGIKFDKPVNFTGSIFNGEIRFVNVEFQDAAIFDGCEFLKVTRFDNTSHKGMTSFVGCAFKDDVQFNGIKFVRKALFNNANFYKKVKFINSSINNAEFHFTNFKNHVEFRNTIFRNQSLFLNSSFNDALFYKVIFKGNIAFQGSKFFNEISFINCKFKRGVYFNNCKFYHELTFWLISFYKEAIFSESLFNSALFTYIYIYDVSFFENCLFLGPTKFRYMFPRNREGILNFIGGHLKNRFGFEQFLNEMETTKRQELERIWGINFEQLKAIVNKGRISMKTVSFDMPDMTFVQFVNVEWDRKGIGIGPLRLDRIVVYDEKLIEEGEGHRDYERLAHIYWGLRRNYERNGRYAEAGDFYISEMEMRRLQIAPPPPRKGRRPTVWDTIRWTVLSWGWWRRNLLSPLAIYKYLSLYGESYVLASLWIFITVLLFTFLRAHLPSQGGQSTGLLDNLARSIFALFQLRGEETIDNIERIIGAILAGNLFIALRRRLERR